MSAEKLLTYQESTSTDLELMARRLESDTLAALAVGPNLESSPLDLPLTAAAGKVALTTNGNVWANNPDGNVPQTRY